jgi:hypothetical protein
VHAIFGSILLPSSGTSENGASNPAIGSEADTIVSFGKTRPELTKTKVFVNLTMISPLKSYFSW